MIEVFEGIARCRRTAGLIGAGAALLVVGVVGAVATIPGPNGVVQGCYSNATGVLRVVGDPTQCITSGNPLLLEAPQLLETPLTWRQTGPQGPAGPAGPIGPAGPQGPTGINTAVRRLNSDWCSRGVPCSIQPSARADPHLDAREPGRVKGLRRLRSARFR